MIDADDYLEYHAKLMSGIFDEDLFKAMRADLLARCREIIENTKLYYVPQDGMICPRCGNEMDWYNDEDENGPYETELGEWKCRCGFTETYANFTDHLFGEITDAHWRLEQYADKLQYSDQDQQRVWFETILQFIHGRGPMADWFIDGGEETLNMVRECKLEPYYQETL